LPLTALVISFLLTTLKEIMDYKKLGRLFSKYEAEKIDTLINVDINLISEYDKIFVKYGFIKVDGQKFLNNMSGRENKVFQLTKSIALDEINFLVRSISKILRDDFDLREIDLLKEQMQTNQLEHDKISKEHQKLNGELREDVNNMTEISERYMKDNKKLAKQIEDFLNKKVNGMRKKGL